MYKRQGQEFNGFKMKQKVKTGRHHSHRIGIVRTNPCGADTDGDGIKDGKEVRGKKVHQKVVTRKGVVMLKRLVSNPALADSDKDGLRDKAEVTGSANKRFKRHKTDPLNYDTDGGRIKDGREVKLGSDPADIKSAPKRMREGTGRLG